MIDGHTVYDVDLNGEGRKTYQRDNGAHPDSRIIHC